MNFEGRECSRQKVIPCITQKHSRRAIYFRVQRLVDILGEGDIRTGLSKFFGLIQLGLVTSSSEKDESDDAGNCQCALNQRRESVRGVAGQKGDRFGPSPKRKQ